MTTDNKDADHTSSLSELTEAAVPDGVDRRAFMMRSPLVDAMAVITGCSPNKPEQAAVIG
jgi:hypothetical protein